MNCPSLDFLANLNKKHRTKSLDIRRELESKQKHSHIVAACFQFVPIGIISVYLLLLSRRMVPIGV